MRRALVRGEAAGFGSAAMVRKLYAKDFDVSLEEAPDLIA
jgi:hypothetical protein